MNEATDAYLDLIARKSASISASGFDVADLAPHLFPHQVDLVRWSLRRGRAALFADTGLGKGLMLLEWAKHVSTRGRVLILAPLAVGPQLEREGARFGVPARYMREDDGAPIVISNYEMRSHFDAHKFIGVVLDESSILKSFDGKTRNDLILGFAATPYKLACTATPAPNDFTELGNHAEFLGIKTRAEMLAEYFVHDGGSTQDWRLKGHAITAFWRWVATWGAVVKLPSDLGHDDGAFRLPPLEMREHAVAATDHDVKATGTLFAMPASGLIEQRKARRATIGTRVAKVAELAEGDELVLVWCELNDEADACEAAIRGAVQVSGEDSNEWKEVAIAWFQGHVCICGRSEFRRKLATWQRNQTGTGKNTTEPTGQFDLLSRSSTSEITRKGERNTTPSTTPTTSQRSQSKLQNTESEQQSVGSPSAEQNTPPTLSHSSSKSKRGRPRILAPGSPSGCENTGSPQSNTSACSNSKAGSVQSAEQARPQIAEESDCTSTTAIEPGSSVDCSAVDATSGSEGSETTLQSSSEPRCTCGHRSGRRVLVSKAAIFGFGLNLQMCHHAVFAGASHSYEGVYQAVRRIWRYGQLRPVTVDVICSELEGAVLENYKRKARDADRMAIEMTAHVGEAVRAEVRGLARTFNEHDPKIPMRIPSWLT